MPSPLNCDEAYEVILIECKKSNFLKQGFLIKLDDKNFSGIFTNEKYYFNVFSETNFKARIKYFFGYPKNPKNFVEENLFGLKHCR